MTDLISREAVKAYIDVGHLRSPTEKCFSELDVVRMLDRFPAVDALPVRRGRWIAQDDTFTRFMCSVCELKNYDGYGNYCPNCGAVMDKTESGE